MKKGSTPQLFDGYLQNSTNVPLYRCDNCETVRNYDACRICGPGQHIIKLCIICLAPYKEDCCKQFEHPSDDITDNDGVYAYKGSEFYKRRKLFREKAYEMPIAFSHFLFRQSQQKIAELEEKLGKVTRTLQDLMDRIEFAPDGEEAAEAIKRLTNLLN